MTNMTRRCRVEVLADEPLIPSILRLAGEAGITHYTLLPTIGGAGTHGRWRDDQLTGATAKVLLLAITSAENCDRFADLLGPLLEPHGLMLMVSETEVMRGARF
jgi:hypothetical protein